MIMRNIQKKKLNIFYEGAVSEAIGFLLIFSLVMIGIGLITLYGYPILLETQSNANVRNMERDMIVLQNDMKSLVYKNVPYKETSLQVAGGSLAVYNYTPSVSPSYFEISVESSGQDNIINANISTLGYNQNHCGQFRYESDSLESIIALENGAVLSRLESQSGSVMLSEPRWFIDINKETGNNTFIIPFMNISSREAMSRNGIGTVKMQMISSDVPLQYSAIDADNKMTVKIKYYHPLANQIYDFSFAWENYFKNSLNMDSPVPPDTYFKRSDIHTLVIKRYNIEIESI